MTRLLANVPKKDIKILQIKITVCTVMTFIFDVKYILTATQVIAKDGCCVELTAAMFSSKTPHMQTFILLHLCALLLSIIMNISHGLSTSSLIRMSKNFVHLIIISVKRYCLHYTALCDFNTCHL